MNKKNLVIIDGYSLLYRAFYAMRYLSTSDGVPTNALYGFTTMLFKVLESDPDYIVVVFDTGKATFRHEEYKEYKAHRPPMPDDLRIQIPIVKDLVKAFGITTLELDGYEADDVIGAIATRASKEGLHSTIVTGDLDALQLVDDNTYVMTTIKGVSESIIYDEAGVIERFGLTPAQIPDYKGLKGDSSDNIPGVPGIGDKTATVLLKEYGTVENLLEHLEDLKPGKVRTSLEENIELAKLSKHLATIVTDLPIDIDIEKYTVNMGDCSKLRELFTRLEFKSMLKRLPEPTEPCDLTVKERAAVGQFEIIESKEELTAFFDEIKIAGVFAASLYTDGNKPISARVLGIALSTGEDKTIYVRLSKPTGDSLFEVDDDDIFCADLEDLKDIMSDENLRKICLDSKLTYGIFTRNKIQPKGLCFDSIIALYLLDSTKSSYNIFDVSIGDSELDIAEDLSTEEKICAEAEIAFRSYQTLKDKLIELDMDYLYYDIEMKLVPVLADMELVGLKIDTSELAHVSSTLSTEMHELEKKVYEIAGEEFNIASPKQLQKILFEKLMLPSGKKTKTGYSTGAEILESLSKDYPIADYILKYRELAKMCSTYADALPKLINPITGRVHTSLNQTVTATGRLSSSEPNLQNIPIRTEIGRLIRRAFISEGEENILVSADYSQIELRVMAFVSGDEGLKAAFMSGEDIHNATACRIFGVEVSEVTPDMRRIAKTVNFAVMYGMSDFMLANSLGITLQAAKAFKETYFTQFPGVLKFTKETIDFAEKNGYVVTQTGRRRYMPDILSSNRNLRNFAQRAAVNMPIQGLAADIMKIAMINTRDAVRASGLDVKILLQVHDELLFEVDKDQVQRLAEIVHKSMETAWDLNLPLAVDIKIGQNWADMNKINE